MKQAALIVKEDGLIYVNEVPEEPIWPDSIPTYIGTMYMGGDLGRSKAKRKYEEALASAKDSAILVSDQDAAWRLVFHQAEMQKMYGFKFDPKENWVSYREGNQHWGRSVKPGIYPIPDLKWERTTRSINGSKLDFEFVAILTPSEPSKGEPQNQ